MVKMSGMIVTLICSPRRASSCRSASSADDSALCAKLRQWRPPWTSSVSKLVGVEEGRESMMCWETIHSKHFMTTHMKAMGV